MKRVTLILGVHLPLSLRRKATYDKRFACYYCGKQCSKLCKHLYDVHKNESEVAKMLSTTTTGSKDREKMLLVLRRRGSYNHNRKVIASGHGCLQVVRRSSHIDYSVADYLPCPTCLGFFLKTHLRSHVEKCCPERVEPVKQARALILTMSDGCTDTEFERVLASLNEDDVASAIKGDELIRLYGKQLHQRYELQNDSQVAGAMRKIGRLLLQARKHSTTLYTATDLLSPKHFDVVIKSVRELCKFGGEKAESIPSLALKLGPALKKLAALLRNQAIRDEDEAKEKSAESYLKLHTTEWGEKITKYALDAVAIKKKTPSLPITKDLQVGDLLSGWQP